MFTVGAPLQTPSGLKQLFPEEYKDGIDYREARQFIKQKFLAKNQNPSRSIIVQFTCATDTHSFQMVFEAAETFIIQKSMVRSGLRAAGAVLAPTRESYSDVEEDE